MCFKRQLNCAILMLALVALFGFAQSCGGPAHVSVGVGVGYPGPWVGGGYGGGGAWIGRPYPGGYYHFSPKTKRTFEYVLLHPTFDL
jgi:hypothetical protein